MTAPTLDVLREAHAGAMMALAADVHPYSGTALRQYEEAFDAALDDLGALVQAVKAYSEDGTSEAYNAMLAAYERVTGEAR